MGAMIIMMLVMMIIRPCTFGIEVWLLRRIGLSRPFDQLLQFTAIEPDSPAFRAVINFNTLFIGHHQWHFADWTIHFVKFLFVLNVISKVGRRFRFRVYMHISPGDILFYFIVNMVGDFVSFIDAQTWFDMNTNLNKVIGTR